MRVPVPREKPSAPPDHADRDHPVKGLAIKDVAERTGLAPGTIRMWEQRYGVPVPARTGAGYRVYSDEDVELLRRAVALREHGLSVSAALERARAAVGGATDRPSVFGAVATGESPVRPQLLRKRTLLAISRAIEDETLARAAGPVVFAAFQAERNYRAVQHRYERLARNADAAVVFAEFAESRVAEGRPAEVPIARDGALGEEWVVVVDAPGLAACLAGWEQPRPAGAAVPDRERRFEAVWTMDPRVVRRAALVGCALAGAALPALGRRLERLLDDRPLAVEDPPAALTALTNRVIAYIEA
jgi:MerR family transcriptional regulator, light-induced transcriptional regulator